MLLGVPSCMLDMVCRISDCYKAVMNQTSHGWLVLIEPLTDSQSAIRFRVASCAYDVFEAVVLRAMPARIVHPMCTIGL